MIKSIKLLTPNLWWKSSFFASTRSSKMLFTRAKRGAKGKALTKIVMKPYCITRMVNFNKNNLRAWKHKWWTRWLTHFQIFVKKSLLSPFYKLVIFDPLMKTIFLFIILLHTNLEIIFWSCVKWTLVATINGFFSLTFMVLYNFHSLGKWYSTIDRTNCLPMKIIAICKQTSI